MHYVAPEVLEGEPPNDRSDVYAFGILLLEIFSENVRCGCTFIVWLSYIHWLPTLLFERELTEYRPCLGTLYQQLP